MATGAGVVSVCGFCWEPTSPTVERVQHPDGSWWHASCWRIEHGTEPADFAEPRYGDDRDVAWAARGGRKGRS